MEIAGRAQAAIPPRRIARTGAHRGARFSLGEKALHHRCPQRIDAADHERINMVVERIPERRAEQDRAGGAGLVVVVNDVRKPIKIEDAVHVPRLGLRVGVEITVVIVADVLLVEARQTGESAFLRVRFAHVPVRAQVHAVGVGVNQEDNNIVEDAKRFGVRGRE